MTRARAPQFASLPALLAYHMTLEKVYGNDLQETIHKVRAQLEGCLLAASESAVNAEADAVLALLRELPELHSISQRTVHALPPMTPIGEAARALAALAPRMSAAHSRYAELLASATAPLAALAMSDRRAPRAQPPSATWQHLINQAASETSSGAQIPLAAQLQRPLQAVERHAALAQALRKLASADASVLDERGKDRPALDTAVAATMGAAADVATAWATALNRARLAAVQSKLQRSKSGRRSALLAKERTLRLESLDLYAGKQRQCLWLFGDFVLLVRPTRDNKAYDLVFEQALGRTAAESISAEPSRKLGPHAFALRSGKGKRYELEAASETEAQRWIRTINETSGPAGSLAAATSSSSAGTSGWAHDEASGAASETSSGPATPRTPRA